MFVILATKPLNDRTKGFRFNFFGKKGIIRQRKFKSNGIKFIKGDCMNAYHFGKTTIYTELSTNTSSGRKFRHVAG